jgi:hypothetical protein
MQHASGPLLPFGYIRANQLRGGMREHARLHACMHVDLSASGMAMTVQGPPWQSDIIPSQAFNSLVVDHLRKYKPEIARIDGKLADLSGTDARLERRLEHVEVRRGAARRIAPGGRCVCQGAAAPRAVLAPTAAAPAAHKTTSTTPAVLACCLPGWLRAHARVHTTARAPTCAYTHIHARTHTHTHTHACPAARTG